MQTRLSLYLASLICLSFGSPAFSGGAPLSAESEAAIVDDAAPGWIWSGMDSFEDPLLKSGSGHSGGPGSYGAYTFKGSYVAVYSMRAPDIEFAGRRHKVGRLRISIDNVVQGGVLLYSGANEYNIEVFHAAGLSKKFHVLKVEPTGGWATVDYIALQREDPSPDAREGAATIHASDSDIGAGKRYISSVPAAPNYPDRGGTSLTNGVAADSRNSPEWQGRADKKQYYQTIDLGENCTVTGCSCLFLQDLQYGIFWPTEVTFFASSDGVTFTPLGLANPQPVSAIISRYTLTMAAAVKARYVSMMVKGNAWTFEDDFKVRRKVERPQTEK